MEDHPGIAFRDGPTGRRAALAAGPDIWEGVLPAEAPKAEDIDLGFLSEKFKLSGGAIRNCSLAGAFQAADEDGPISMRHLVRAVAQEYGKQGRLTLEADFERFHDIIRVGAGRGPGRASPFDS